MLDAAGRVVTNQLLGRWYFIGAAFDGIYCAQLRWSRNLREGLKALMHTRILVCAVTTEHVTAIDYTHLVVRLR